MSALITNSRAKSARLCARKHAITYLQGYRPIETSEDLSFGSLVHAGLEAWWCHAVPGIHPDERLSAAMLVIAESQVDAYLRVKAQVMLAAYHARWAGEAFSAVAVEVQFESPLRNPDTSAESKIWRLSGKLDAVVRDAEGGLWLMEHKTSSEDLTPGGNYWKRLRMDSQVSIYFDGARALGHEVRGCIYDVLSKPSQRPLKATPEDKRKITKEGKLYAGQRLTDETPEEYGARIADIVMAAPADYVARIEVPRLESELDDARRDLWQQAQRLREDERLGRAPRNPDSCNAYGRVCEFFDVCTGTASLDDPTRFKRLTDVHPELAGPPAISKEESPT